MSTRIRYIGKAQTKGDRFTNSGVKWDHPGQVKVVSDETAARLLNYPSAWVKEGAENDPGPDALYQVNGLAGASRICDSEGNDVDQQGVPTGAVVDSGNNELPEGESKFTYSADPEEAIMQAIRQLDPKNSEHFTDEGLPRVEAISDLLGYAISAADRTKLWEEVQSGEPLTAADANGEVEQPAVVV